MGTGVYNMGWQNWADLEESGSNAMGENARLFSQPDLPLINICYLMDSIFYYSGKKNMEHLENVISIDESVSSTTFIKIDVLWIHLFSQARYNVFNRFWKIVV